MKTFVKNTLLFILLEALLLSTAVAWVIKICIMLENYSIDYILKISQGY